MVPHAHLQGFKHTRDEKREIKVWRALLTAISCEERSVHTRLCQHGFHLASLRNQERIQWVSARPCSAQDAHSAVKPHRGLAHQWSESNLSGWHKLPCNCKPPLEQGQRSTDAWPTPSVLLKHSTGIPKNHHTMQNYAIKNHRAFGEKGVETQYSKSSSITHFF